MFKYPEDRITTSDGGHNLSTVQSSQAIQVQEVLHCCLQNIEILVSRFYHHDISASLSSSKFTPLANAAGEVIVKALVPRRHCRQYQR